MINIELHDLINGGLQEQFRKSFEKVVENLQNPNTPFKNKREICIKLKFTQNEKRDDVKCDVIVTEKLAPQAPMETSFAIGTDLKTGKVYAMEYGKQVKGQLSIDDSMNQQQAEETAPVTESAAGNVVDLRAAANK